MNKVVRLWYDGVPKEAITAQRKRYAGESKAGVKLQGRITRPFQITIPAFAMEKGRITDADIQEQVQNIALSSPEDGFPISSDTGWAEAEESGSGLDTEGTCTTELAFLTDV